MKLIDVLVMISKGELKEGTRIKYDNEIYTYDKDELRRADDICLCEDIYLSNLNDECEIVEENITEKIEEIWGYMMFRTDYDRDKVIIDKLNEVIRRINNERL